jgi:UDP-glucose-4-epimerase GalE
MRVLVTGGAGYIGSHATRLLRNRGYDAVVYDNFCTGHRSLVQGVECIIGDVGDRAGVEQALDGVDAVMHFAAHSAVGESVADPQKYFENNVQSGIALLSAVRRARTPYFIFSSSCAVYGLPQQIPISEDAARLPINSYGTTKLAMEHALEAYGAAYGLRFVSLRYFNAAGADESGEIGELHEPETHLIPRALQAVSADLPRIDLYGADYPTPDGTCIRDYVHVNDLAEAHLLALEYLVRGGCSKAFNLGTGNGSSVLDVLAAVERTAGRTLYKNLCPRRPGDPPMLLADSQRARDTLNWRPKRTLQQMVATAWNWHRLGRGQTCSTHQSRQEAGAPG